MHSSFSMVRLAAHISVFFSMSKGNESTSIVEEYLCSSTIELNRNINVIRLNYLGELFKIIPDGF